MFLKKKNIYMTVNNCVPNITFILHLSLEESRERCKQHGELDRSEKEDDKFHESIINGFLEIASEDNRCEIIPANGSIEEVHSNIKTFLDKEWGYVL